MGVAIDIKVSDQSIEKKVALLGVRTGESGLFNIINNSAVDEACGSIQPAIFHGAPGSDNSVEFIAKQAALRGGFPMPKEHYAASDDGWRAPMVGYVEEGECVVPVGVQVRTQFNKKSAPLSPLKRISGDLCAVPCRFGSKPSGISGLLGRDQAIVDNSQLSQKQISLKAANYHEQKSEDPGGILSEPSRPPVFIVILVGLGALSFGVLMAWCACRFYRIS